MTHQAILQTTEKFADRSGLVGNWACPDCGQPADLIDRYTLASTNGPVEHIRLRCDEGRHHHTLIIERQRR